MTEEQKRALDAVSWANVIRQAIKSKHVTIELAAALTALDNMEKALTAQTVTDDKTPEKWAFDGHPRMDKWMRHLASYGCHMNMAEWHAFCVDVHESIRAATTPKPCECDALVKALEWVANTGKTIIGARNIAKQALATHRKNKEQQ